MKIITWIVVTVVGLVALVAVAGFIKFTILQDDIYIQQPDGSVVKYNDLPEESTVDYYEDGTKITYCDAAGNRYSTASEAKAAGLSEAEYGATFCPEYLNPVMHPSWNTNGDGLNDCESDGTCDDSVDYTQPRE